MTKLPAFAMMATMAANAQPVRPQVLTLRVDSGNVPGTVLAHAKAEASMILSQLGIRVHWKTYDANLPPHPVDPGDIDILILDESRPHDHPGALGYALPFAKSGFRIVIFYDRIRRSTDRPSPELFGHVIAHEVGHMLLGVLSHSTDGVMRAHWQSQDITAMQMHPLQFSPDDIRTIAQRFAQRHAASAPPSNPSE